MGKPGILITTVFRLENGESGEKQRIATKLVTELQNSARPTV